MEATWRNKEQMGTAFHSIPWVTRPFAVIPLTDAFIIEIEKPDLASTRKRVNITKRHYQHPAWILE